MTNLNLPDESWLPIPGLLPIYFVSNLGRVKSNDHMVYKEVAKKEVLRKGKILSVTHTLDGYRQVTLYGGKIRKQSYRINNLVFFTFNPHVSKVKGYEVDHIDNNKENDSLSNLQYIPCRHNSAKRSLNLKKTSRFTGVSWSAKRNKWQVHIRIKGKSKSLGRYVVEEDAAMAYMNALQTL